MKTNVIAVKNDGTGILEALNEAERFADYQHFSHKDSLRLRLLAEEMTGFIRSLVGDFYRRRARRRGRNLSVRSRHRQRFAAQLYNELTRRTERVHHEGANDCRHGRKYLPCHRFRRCRA